MAEPPCPLPPSSPRCVPCRLRGSGLLRSSLSSFPASPRGTAGLGACGRCGSAVCVAAGHGDSAGGRPQPRTGGSEPAPSRGAWARRCCLGGAATRGHSAWEGVAFLFFLFSFRVSGRGLCWQMSCKAQLSVSVQRYRSQAQTDQVGGGEPVFLSFLASEVLKSAKNTVVLHIYSVGKCCHTFGHGFAERLTG